MFRGSVSARVTAGIGVTLGVLLFALWWAGQTGWATPDFWLGASFLGLGWAVVLDEMLRFRVRFPNAYHRLRAFEADGRLYRRMGVHVFKRFVVNGDYMNRIKRAHRPAYRLIRSRTDAMGWEQHSRTTEAAHMMHLLLLAPALAFAMRAGRVSFAAWTLVLLIGFDLYPVLLQRYNRARVARLSGDRGLAHQCVAPREPCQER